MNIALHLERLVLDGISMPPGQQRLLHDALEAELTRLLAVRGPRPDWHATYNHDTYLPRLAGAAIELGPDGDPVRLGRQIAQSVFGSIAP